MTRRAKYHLHLIWRSTPWRAFWLCYSSTTSINSESWNSRDIKLFKVHTQVFCEAWKSRQHSQQKFVLGGPYKSCFRNRNRARFGSVLDFDRASYGFSFCFAVESSKRLSVRPELIFDLKKITARFVFHTAAFSEPSWSSEMRWTRGYIYVSRGTFEAFFWKLKHYGKWLSRCSSFYL